MLRLSFARFSSFAFVARCFATLRVDCGLFCFAFRFVLAVFALSPFTGLWVFFPLARFSSFFWFLSVLLHAWFFSFLLSVPLSYNLPLRSMSVLFSLLHFSFLASVTLRGVRYYSVLLVWPFVDRMHCRFVRACV